MINQLKINKKINKGIILIEIAIGLAFVGFTLMGLTYLFTTGMEASLHSNYYTQAIYLAEEKIEETTLFPYTTLSSWSTDFVTMNKQDYQWTRSIQPMGTNSNLYHIQVQVQWEEIDGNHQLNLVSRGLIKP